ncbi:MAG TPA: VWA domain-containing protein [Candidatus Dormibacteraeota bacterium]|nr:VWA domain-containing protein [Candidatus Dormibacteraeota bacterium]
MSDRGLAAVVGFARALREAGVRVPAGAARLCAQALGALDATRPRSLYWATRLSMLRRHDDLPAFERIFQAYWASAHELVLAEAQEPERTALQVVPLGEGAPEEADDEDEEPLPASLASSLERLRETDFAEYTDEEHRLAARLVEGLRITMPVRRSRRTRPAPHGRHVDLPRTLRRSLRTAGDPVHLVYARRRTRARPLVLLCDVSGSMSAYSRALVQFLRAAVESRARVRVFAFGTRLAELTHPLSKATRDEALRAAAARFDDWGGGTRIGASLQAFVREYAQRGVARGGVVVILSDGWEREDPALVGEQMHRLRLLCHRIIWVNPNKKDPRFEPLAAGMASALPYVDALVAGHHLRALEDLLALVRRLGDEESRR